jgi:predicted aminopeptidase
MNFAATIKLSILQLCALSALNSHAYLVKQGVYLLSNQMRAKKISTLIRKNAVTSDELNFFTRVEEIKRFATYELGLTPSKNYTTYIRTGDDRLITVFCAARPDTLALHRWSFPFFGSFPYLGFYEERDAVRKKEKMEHQGFEVFTADVDAFSTLGILKDPLYTFMEKYSEYSLANLILHELCHATIFVKNAVDFNEQLASFIGHTGALAYLQRKYGNEAEVYRQTVSRLEENDRFDGIIRTLYGELYKIYGSGLNSSALIAEKKAVIARHKNAFIRDYQKLFTSDRFKRYATFEWNNAFVLYCMTYEKTSRPFTELLKKNNNDLKLLILALKPLDKTRNNPGTFLKQLLEIEGASVHPPTSTSE